MLFNSPVYIFLFLPLVVIIYFVLNRYRLVIAGKTWLVAASLFFYGYWNPKYLILIVISMLVNFAIGTALHRAKRHQSPGSTRRPSRLHVLISGVVFNLGLLGYFKYADFMIANASWLLDTDIGLLELALPLAISFFTFQQIAYLVDCYQTDTQDYDFLNYCLFVTFFPQLIAGPIVHHREMMPQFTRVRGKLLNWSNAAKGVFIFALGLFKKVVIADSFAVWANLGFDSERALNFFEAWGTSLSYTFQLYYDFSGYSDMAIGAALLFNIRLPINFNSPYKAVSIQDFWRRWHMTLSRWLRDYVYIPLGGNRRGKSRTYVNLLATFILGGLWHGAGWTFIAWGAMHGIALALHRLWNQMGFQMSKLSGWLITFLFINTTWVFFRAETFDGAIRVLKGMAGMNDIGVTKQFASTFNYLVKSSFIQLEGLKGKFLIPIEALEYIVVFAMVAFLLPNSVQMVQLLPYKGRFVFSMNFRYALFLVGIFVASILTFVGDVAPSEFLYFNF